MSTQTVGTSERRKLTPSEKAKATSDVKKAYIAKQAQIGPLHEAAARREMAGVMAQAQRRVDEGNLIVPVVVGLRKIGHGTLDIKKDFDYLECDQAPSGIAGGVREDPGYQRGSRPSATNIAIALAQGGMLIDPITIVRRPWAENGGKKNNRWLWWVLDGQQRLLASISAGRNELDYVLYESDSREAEALAFLSRNALQDRIASSQLVLSCPGPAGDLIREVDIDAKHPLYERVYWSAGGSKAVRNISALSVLKGMAVVCGAVHEPLHTSKLKFEPLRAALSVGFDKDRAETFLQLLGMCSAKGKKPKPSALFVLALAQVAADRWIRGNLKLPTNKQAASLRSVDWARVGKQSMSLTMLPVVRERIRSIWK